MPIEYTCRKCNKTYSNLEYEQSRFCRVCGSFLLRSFRDDRYAEMLAQKSFRHPASAAVGNGSFKEKIALTRAAESLSERIARSKEYEVISETKNKEEYPEDSVEHWIWSGEYDQALILEKKLVKQYDGKSLEETVVGKTVSNQQGECYEISASCASTFKTATYQESRQLIISDLKALPGIGPAREKKLKQQGYKTIEDLESHLLWRKPALLILQIRICFVAFSADVFYWQFLFCLKSTQ